MDILRLKLGRSIGLILKFRCLLPRGIEVFKAAITEFFLPQFQTRLLPGFRPISVIEHREDASLPFVPSYVRSYLGYISIWLKTLRYLYDAFGKQALTDIEQMIRDICLIYYAAGRVYRRCQSTTTSRRTPLLNPYFILIRLFDPHLACIPSLHVMTMCYNYHKTRQIVMELNSGQAGKEVYTEAAAQTHTLALQITEAILLVKQHSLVDIGPSLFLLSSLFPEYDQREAERFIRGLFENGRVVGQETKARLHAGILQTYEEMLERKRLYPDKQAADIIVEFLEGFRKQQSGRAAEAWKPSRLLRRRDES
jgi:hypothetical protein